MNAGTTEVAVSSESGLTHSSTIEDSAGTSGLLDAFGAGAGRAASSQQPAGPCREGLGHTSAAVR